MADVTAHLERALAADAPADVLAALLAAWRAYPHPRIAELIDRATHNAVAGAGVAPRVDTGSLDDRQDRWLAIAKRRDPLDMPWLLAHVVESRGDEMRERVEVLAALPRDPRIAMALVELCRGKPMSTRTHRPIWTKLFGLMSRGLDVRLVPVVAKMLEELQAVTDFDAYLIAKLRRLHAQLVAAGPAPALAPALVAVLDKLATKLSLDERTVIVRTAEDFLREIWATPGDDGPREVFADWLIERGDPRGELITLQIARARGTADRSGATREQKLLAAHARVWMGPLEPAVSRTAFRFERGFLAACEVQWRKLAALPALMTHPAWATVREYRLPSDGEHACDRWLDHMIALGAKRL